MSAPTPAAALSLLVGETSPEVTKWPERLALTLLVVAVVALTVYGMWHGWRGRGRRQSFLPELPEVPPVLGPAVAECEGRYVGTVFAPDWLDRVVARGLGAPGRAGAAVYPSGFLIDRDGEPPVFIPHTVIDSVTTGRGLAANVAERDGLMVVTWHLGDSVLATAFRADITDEQSTLAAALAALVPAGGS